MAQTPREIVRRTLTFEHPARLPRQIWALPWAGQHLPATLAEIERRWPGDFAGPPGVYRAAARQKGDPYAVGQSSDDWGCRFENIQAGVHGEIKDPILKNLDDWKSIRPPEEILPADASSAREKVDAACAASDRFMFAGCNPRPWERYQFIRGSENALMDMMELDRRSLGLLRTIHEFHLREFEFWVRTGVDAVNFMDDWGSQRQLLIPPRVWREVFKPLYKDYCDLARAHGKFVFMHSDGHIGEIYEDLIEIGVNALNSQLFCMDIPELGRRFKGKIAFWGEMDRQHILTAANPRVGRDAVRRVAAHLFDPAGGIIIQFEIGPGANPETVLAVLEEWEAVQREAGMSP